MEFVRVPSGLIHSSRINSKRVLLYTALLFQAGGRNECDLNSLISFCSFSADRHKYAATNQYRQIIDDLKWISVKWECSNRFSFQLEPFDHYGIIYRQEFADIIEYRNRERTHNRLVNHSNLLLVLAYVRLHMDNRSDKPNTHFTFIKTIANDTGISTRSVSAAIKQLEELNILRTKDLPHYMDKDHVWHSAVKIFANSKTYRCSSPQPNDWERDIQRTIKLISVVNHEKEVNMTG